MQLKYSEDVQKRAMEWRAGHGARTLRRSRSHPGLAQLSCVEASPAGKEVLISGENGTISPPAMLLGDIPILQEQECSLSWNLFQHWGHENWVSVAHPSLGKHFPAVPGKALTCQLPDL